MKPGNEPDPPPGLGPKARRHLNILYLCMAIGLILPFVLYFLFGVSEE